MQCLLINLQRNVSNKFCTSITFQMYTLTLNSHRHLQKILFLNILYQNYKLILCLFKNLKSCFENEIQSV